MKITLLKGDITKIEVDAIVNAANSSLLGGGGVDGAIHRVAGPQLLEECKAIRNRQGGCKTGNAVITGAGNLPCQFVIHTVGPVWNDRNKQEMDLLRSCYENSLLIAIENGVKSIAFPNISTGIYKFPKADACKIALNAIANFKNRSVIDEVKFICFDDENYQLYQRALQINEKNEQT